MAYKDHYRDVIMVYVFLDQMGAVATQHIIIKSQVQSSKKNRDQNHNQNHIVEIEFKNLNLK